MGNNNKSKERKTNSYLVFHLQEEGFAINVGKVLSILQMQKVTTVPESPDYMTGVINLRGDVIPIIDSHVKFSLDPINVTMKTNILVLEIGRQNKKALKLGFMVDRVSEVLQIPEKKILPPPGIGDVYQSRYITGVFQKDENNFVMLLDIEKALSIKEITSLKEATETNTVPVDEENKKEAIEAESSS